ncbi:MAG: hypothetical protein M3O31_11210 [Acidobacteriota bacterium]|nr:hypothetical protein [Acidobacteriota bacterium]
MPKPSPRIISVSAARAVKVAVDLVEQQQEWLRAILESKQATPEQKFEALVDLAHLAGILLREVAEADGTPQIVVNIIPVTIDKVCE